MSYADRIRPAVQAELDCARHRLAAGEPAAAFRHLERAHVLGQASTREHLRSHWQMLRWAVAQRDRRELFGQLLRLIGAATKTFVGLIPEGNTGGAKVSPLRHMPIPRDLARVIAAARRR